MRMTATPSVLQYFSRAVAHSRICETLPGEESESSVCMVCMESMTRICGWVSMAVASIFSRFVSA